MSRRRPKRDDFRRLAGDVSPEDGSDPKEFHQKPWSQPKQAGRKAKQLCEQVHHALLGALAVCADPALQAVSVVRVQPAPHTGRLLVLVSVPADIDPATGAEALSRASGFLRGEVAAAISRRYAPELTFEVVPV
ncbi:MAG: hypothetical protein K2V38_06685 [Gemmataceae bacterium]|nr:hypothetical protein [Gemmataceae bacterium]